MTAAEQEIERLRACLKALEEASGKQTLRVEIECFTKPKRLTVLVTCSSELREQDVGDIIISHLETFGLRREPPKPRKGAKRG